MKTSNTQVGGIWQFLIVHFGDGCYWHQCEITVHHQPHRCALASLEPCKTLSSSPSPSRCQINLLCKQWKFTLRWNLCEMSKQDREIIKKENYNALPVLTLLKAQFFYIRSLLTTFHAQKTWARTPPHNLQQMDSKFFIDYNEKTKYFINYLFFMDKFSFASVRRT